MSPAPPTSPTPPPPPQLRLQQSVAAMPVGFAGISLPASVASAAVLGMAKMTTRRIVPDDARERVGGKVAGRTSSAEAWVAQHVGAEASAPCTNCTQGYGPFKGRPCVVVPDLLLGACAGCHFNSQGTKCSFRAAKRKDLEVDDVDAPVPKRSRGSKPADPSLAVSSAPPQSHRKSATKGRRDSTVPARPSRSVYDQDQYAQDLAEAREMTSEQRRVESLHLRGRLLALEVAEADE
ncbi:hypothetical protein V498_04569 [Pseudogymnoascus sp. VKM F-4517 (FW-2822)]|nr:hypothetical protein V498_04569 [Pseudogymnoascus sp. VKM F-4517 (FW-2822)]